MDYACYNCGAQMVTGEGITVELSPEEAIHFCCEECQAESSRAEAVARIKWNAEADEYNQWDSLGQDEKDELIIKKEKQ
jgi:hypothetical protein